MRRNLTSAISVIVLLIALAPAAQAQHTITTVAGGVPKNVPALQVGVGAPPRVFRDAAGNLYISVIVNGTEGLYGNVVNKVDSFGQLTTVAGNGTEGFSGDGGPATSAALSGPHGLFVDRFGNIFIAETYNDRIREVVAATGNIQTVAGNGTFGFSGDGGLATSAALSGPHGLFVDRFGNIFIADSGNQRIRKVDAATGNIQTVAVTGTFGFSGDGGPATNAELAQPTGVYVDNSGNLFIVDTYNSRIREVDAATGIIQTVAGNGTFGFSGDGGPATSAELDLRVGFSNVITGDRQGNLLIAEESNSRIRRISGLVAVVGITVGPTAPTMNPASTQQFTANVTSARNTAVTWSLSGTGCAGRGCGTISPRGLYKAPWTLDDDLLTVTVTATSVADNTKSASATVTIRQGEQDQQASDE